MKKVLIITDLYHASPRITSLAKYLPEWGWQATILTGTLPRTSEQKFKVIKSPFPDAIVQWKKRLFLDPNKGFQRQIGIPFSFREGKGSFTSRLVELVEAVIAYPDEHKGWKPFALKAANGLFRKEKIDVMISSSSPVTSHIIAKDLKDKYDVPWIADLRDLWTQNHNYRYGKIRKRFEKRLELNILKRADALVTVSPVWAGKLRKLHGRKFVHSITNGFDPVEVNPGQVGLTSKFTITYTGQVYTGKQDSSKLFAALKSLISDGSIDINHVEVRFYGPENESLGKEMKRYDFTNIVRQYGLIPREISLQKQRESQLLLVLYWEDTQEKGWYPLKVFEYLAAQRPILVIGGSGDDVVEELLNETKAGVYCKNIEEIKNSLYHFYSEYKKEKEVSYKGDLKEINKYNYREMAKKFVGILNSFKE